MPTLDVHDHTITYAEFGAPDLPPVILVHGLMGDWTTVAPLAELLSARFHVVAPDALGHGHSDHPSDFTIQDQGAMLTGLVAALGYDSAALVGISMGSYLVAQAAILEPARVSKLVLIVGKAHGTTSSSAAYAARKGFDLTKLSPEEALALMSDAVWSPHTSQQRRDELLAQMNGSQTPLTPTEQSAVERSLAGFDLRPGLSGLDVPTLVISGLDDGLNPPSAGQELADHIAGARFEVYDRSGHMLAFEEPERLVADLTAFLT